MKYIITLILFFSFTVTAISQNFTIIVSNPPQFDTSTLNLTEAGNNFSITSIQSTNETNISIGNFFTSGNYRISAYLGNPITPLTVEVDLTGFNSPLGNLTQDYTNPPAQLSLTPVKICDASKLIFNSSIKVKFTIKNLSVINPAGTINMSVVFTVTGI